MYEITIKEILETGLDITSDGVILTFSFENCIGYTSFSFTLNIKTNEIFYKLPKDHDYSLIRLGEWHCLEVAILNMKKEYKAKITENSFSNIQCEAKKEFKNSYFLNQVEDIIVNNGFYNSNSTWSKTHPTCKVYRQGQGYPKVVLDTATQELAIFRTAKEEVFEGRILDLHFLDRVFKSVTL